MIDAESIHQSAIDDAESIGQSVIDDAESIDLSANPESPLRPPASLPAFRLRGDMGASADRVESEEGDGGEGG